MRELNLVDFLKQQENLSNDAYLDSKGYVTIGYGHNLEVDANFTGWTKEELLNLSFTDEECEELFKIDLEKAREATERILVDHKLATLNDTRRNVLIAMVFQMGANGVRGFHDFLHACFMNNFDEAAREMLDSKWKLDTAKRCQILAEIMQRGGVIEPTA